MSLQESLKARLLKDAEATCKEMGVLDSHPHLPALYAQYELDNIMQQVKSLFVLRGKKGVTWNQLANVHNRVVEANGGTQVEDAKKALQARKDELAETIEDLKTSGLSTQRKAVLTKRKAYREARVEKAEAHLVKCENKLKFVDELKRKASLS